MDGDECFRQRISEAHPGYTTFITRLTTLASVYLPPFIYLTDTNNPRVTASVVDAIFEDISSISDAPPTYYAHINAVACFTARIFYDTVLNALAGWKPSWDNRCQVWPGDDTQSYNDGIDSFIHGLRRLRVELMGAPPAHGKGKGKGKGKAVAAVSGEEPTMVLLIESAERLYESLPDLIVPLTRLAELSQVNVSVILLSSVHWEEIRPPLGASPDPYYINVDPQTKEVSAFCATSQAQSSRYTEQYVDTLYSTISIYTNDPLELQYIAAARWPGFVKPLIDQYNKLVQEAEEQGADPPELDPPGTEGRLRLFKYFLPTFTAALDALYPRITNAADLGCRQRLRYNRRGSTYGRRCRRSWHRINPGKSDMRMFGRGAEERKKRRRKSAFSQENTDIGRTFPLDRLLCDPRGSRPHDPRFELPGEYTDMEIGRIHVYAAIAELTFMRALHRTTAMDKLDGPPVFKCGISHEVALALARDVEVPLNELIWDPA
ncbi:putative origin recognition complex, subunit 5-like protein [Melanogaster broomeanus]|nr:putative origin recognition complex, subunit 5-like protein [Melanogaster broomeanus]